MIKNRHWKMGVVRVLSYWSGWIYVLIQEEWNSRQVQTMLTRLYTTIPLMSAKYCTKYTLRLLFTISGYLPTRIRRKYYGNTKQCTL